MSEDAALKQELSNRIKHHQSLKWFNGCLSEALTWIMIAVSGAMTIITSGFPDSKFLDTNVKWIVILSPLPAILELIRRNIGFHVRSSIHRERETRLRIIRRELTTGLTDSKEAVRRWNTMEEEMDKRQGGLGSWAHEVANVPPSTGRT